ncbi:MAG: GNAT family N-acetyltransferase [Pyrinomonadaceae bacterium]
MSISLREITKENFSECVKLKVAEGQEGFVAPNVYSIAQTKVYPANTACAVYDDDEMVGFVMYGLDEDDGRYYLGRLMIDEKFQNRGYGRAAVLEVIQKAREIDGCEKLYLSIVPGNTSAEKLYSDIGFEKTGEILEGEIVMRFDLAKAAVIK